MPNSPKTDNKLPGSVLTDRQIHYLKIANIVMGIILVMGFIALIVGLYLKAKEFASSQTDKISPSQSATETLSRPAATPSSSLPHKFFENITLKAGAGAKVRSVQRTGTILQILVDENKATTIYFIDLENGKTLSRVKVLSHIKE